MGRTTLIIDDQRLVELKRLAAERRQTMSSLVDEFLSAGIQQARRKPRKAARATLPTYDMGVPAVNVADRDQLYNLMERR